MKRAPKILIVEDERIVAEDIKVSLENQGYIVSAVVTSGERALQKVGELKPDLVLVDIVLLGEINGIEAADQIRSRFDIPVVYLTAYADGETLERAKVTEPFGYILKPFEERELYSAIEMALYKHRMESGLRASEQWLATTLKSIADGVIATDSKGYVTFMNPVAEALTGWKQGDAVGKPVEEVFNIVNEKTGEQAENPVKRVIREGIVVGLANHTVLIAKDGTERPVDDSGAPIRDERGNIIGVVIVFQDITERNRAEKALASERNLLKSMLDSIPISVYCKDKDARFVHVSKGFYTEYGEAYRKKFGIKLPEDLIGKTDLDLFLEEHAKKMFEEDKRVIDKGEPIVDNLEYITATDGTRLYTVTTKVPWFDDNGNIIGLMGATRDVTKSKQAEEELRKSELKYRNLVESIEEGLSIVDERENFTFVNQSAAEIFGYSKEELIGKNLREFTSPEEFQHILDQTTIGKEGKSSKYELTINRKNGKQRTVMVTASPLVSDDNKYSGAFSIFMDITKRKKAEDELKQRHEELKRFNRLSVDREIKMIELKKEINELLEKSGKKPRYKIVETP